MAAGLAACALGGALCAWLHTPLPWMIGSLVTMATLRMMGMRLEAVPGGRAVGQLVVGVSLGLYFTAPAVHEVAAYWPWFVFLGFAAIGLGAASALVLLAVGKVDRATAYFSSMPGGAADMADLDPAARGGQYYGPDGRFEFKGYPRPVKSTGRSHDEQAQRRLWQESERLTGVTYPV